MKIGDENSYLKFDHLKVGKIIIFRDYRLHYLNSTHIPQHLPAIAHLASM